MVALFASVLVANSCNAIAGFVVVNPPKPKPIATKPLASTSAPTVSPSRAGVMEIGIRPGTIETRKGFVRDLPMKVALQQIVPPGWQSEIVVADARKASWNTGANGQPWIDALRQVAAAEQLYGEVDWVARKVRITDQAVASKVVETTKPPTDSKQGPRVATTPVLPAAPPPAPAPVARFDVRKGETLMTALQRWCAQSGWTLLWKSEDDIRPDAGIQLPPGLAFEDAVRELMRSVWVEYPDMSATAYKNRVLVVESKGGMQ